MEQLGGTGIIGEDIVCSFGNGKYKTFEGTEISIENCMKAKVKDLVVEGKTIQDIEDLSIIESVGESEGILNIVNRGKNIFEPNNLESGSINPSSGANVFNTAQVRSINFIAVKPSTSYVINKSCRIFEYNKTKGYIGSSAVSSQSFITSSNTYFLKIHKSTLGNGLIEKIQLEEGTVATSYEPYREPIITNINMPIPLRSLPNGVADTIEGDKLVQKVGKVVYNGSEDWKLQSVNYNENGLLNVYCLIEDLIVKTSEKQSLICNKYIPQKTAIANTTTEGVLINNEKRLYLRLFLDKATTVAEAKEYIKNNPFTVYYPLATPIIHNLEIPSISTTKGTNVITTTNNIKPNLKIKVKIK